MNLDAPRSGPKRRARRAALFAAVLAATAVLPAAATAATASGTFSLDTPAYNAANPEKSASWHIDGQFLPLRAELSRLGIAPGSDDYNGYQRFVAATLTGARSGKVTEACDGMDADTPGSVSTWYDGVAAADSSFEVALRLDYLRNTGRATVTVAGPYSAGSPDPMAPGKVFWHRSWQGCATEFPQDGTTSEPRLVIANTSPSLYLGNDINVMKTTMPWRLQRTASGAWHMGGSQTFSEYGFQTTAVRADLTFTGTGAGFHADCTLPTARDLRRARTWRQADALARRAGFTSTSHRTMRMRPLARGRFFTDVMLGISATATCGTRIKLYRSLGWP